MAKNSNTALNWIVGAAVAYFAGITIAGAIKRRKGTSGIGAARKRRIYKELSLAQQAGVDFTKPYDELTEDEIQALQQVSNETGYTETYYKSLQKAYNAISGIGGETYDVVNADGDTVLTWIEDPDGSEQRTAAYSAANETDYDYLRYAHEVEDDRMWADQEHKRKIDEMEARLAEGRKNAKRRQREIEKHGLLNWDFNTDKPNGKTDGQQSLFGIGYAPARTPYWYGIPSVQFIPHGEWSDPEIKYRGKYYNAVTAENELYAIWREALEYGDTVLDFEKWMSMVGGDYLKSEVLPYI